MHESTYHSTSCQTPNIITLCQFNGCAMVYWYAFYFPVTNEIVFSYRPFEFLLWNIQVFSHFSIWIHIIIYYTSMFIMNTKTLSVCIVSILILWLVSSLIYSVFLWTQTVNFVFSFTVCTFSVFVFKKFFPTNEIIKVFYIIF